MPNFAYTNQTNFRPFSYQEMLAPVLMATQAHQAVEEAYSELDSQANAIGSLANEANDPVTYQRYKAYESALRTQADALAKNGLTPGSRQSLLDLKSRYAKDITPIQNAITRRRELADEQRKALLQNPTLMFQRDMNSMSYESSLDRFLENPDYDYGERYSGALLTQQVSQAAGNLAKELYNYGNGKKLDAYTKTFLQQHGFTRDQVLDAISNPNRAQSQPVLNAIVEQVMGSSDMASWADQPTMDKAYNYARQGLWSAIGQTNVSTYEDYGAKLAAQEAMQKRAAEQAQLNNLAINPLNIYSNRELSKDEKKYKDNIENFSKYFYKDSHGQMRMNQAGWKEYNRKNYGEVAGKVMTTPEGTTIRVASSNGKESASEFRKFMDSIGAAKVTNGNWQPGNFGNAWSKYVYASPAAKTAKYDATMATEFDYPVAGAQQGDMKDAIMTAGRGLSLKEVDYDSKSREFKDTGEEITMEDLKSNKYKVTATRFSPYGATVMIQDDKGNVRRYRMPAGINTTNEQNRDARMKWAEVLQNNRSGGRIRIPDDYARLKNIPIGTTITATPEQVQNEYNRTIQESYLFHSQLGVQNKTKEQEFNPYGY